MRQGDQHDRTYGSTKLRNQNYVTYGVCNVM